MKKHRVLFSIAASALLWAAAGMGQAAQASQLSMTVHGPDGDKTYTLASASPTLAMPAAAGGGVYAPRSFTGATAHAQRVDALASFILSYNKNLPWPEANLIAEAILSSSQFYQIDPRLVTSMIAVESSFRRDAISSSGAIGLGQLKPDTATWLGVGNPFDPIQNVAGMSRYLAWLIRRYNGSYDHAVSAYFQGQGTIDRNGITEVCLPYLYRVNSVLARF